MEYESRSRFTDRILHDAIRRYGITLDEVTLLDGFESYIYEFKRDGSAFILRIGHSRRRTPDLIQGEVEWINHLADGGAGVARAIRLDTGHLVEAIDDDQGGQFLATAFVKAPGRPAGKVGWTPAFYEAYGRLLGRIHALSKTYAPSGPAIRRYDWNHPQNLDVLDWLPANEPIIMDRFREVLNHLDRLPRTADGYGLIHQDAHPGNFLVTGDGQITLFDFDDCVYAWYVYDVAMVVFYMVTNHPDPNGLMQEFWPRFWTGYCTENTLDPAWLNEIPPFLKLREIDLYALHFRSFEDVHNIELPWSAQFMKGRKERIEANVPVVGYDFTG